jgi:hypothetical protein
MKSTYQKFLSIVWMILISSMAFSQSADWNQWGGTNRNFKSAAKGLAVSWSPTGPRKLWQRQFGEGYSAIAATDGKLFTMYRKGDTETVVALDAANGKTLWEFPYNAPFAKEYDMSHGEGPHATLWSPAILCLLQVRRERCTA